jgi:hypothetical protein
MASDLIFFDIKTTHLVQASHDAYSDMVNKRASGAAARHSSIERETLETRDFAGCSIQPVP